jgi:hypothetical protein
MLEVNNKYFDEKMHDVVGDGMAWYGMVWRLMYVICDDGMMTHGVGRLVK